MSYLGTNKIGKMYLGSTAIGKAYLGSNLVFQQGGVQPVMIPYIRGGADGSYIDTGITPDDTTKVIVWARNVNPAAGWFFGGRIASKNSQLGLFLPSTSPGAIRCLYYNNAVYDANDQFANLSGYHKYELYQGVLKVDDIVRATGSTGTFSCPHNLYLFGMNTAGTLASPTLPIDISACQIYKNGTLVRDYTAVNSPSVGLYDAVSQTLFTNSGSGSFTYGTFDKNAYTPLEYIECDGNQYFDSGAYGGYSTQIISKFRFTKNTQNVSLLGYRGTDFCEFDINYGSTVAVIYRLATDSTWRNMYQGASSNIVNADIVLYKGKTNAAQLYKNNAAFGSQISPTSSQSFITSGTLFIGGLNRGDSSPNVQPFTGRLYCNIIGSSRSFVPAQRGTRIGMYDTYNDVFYTSITSTPFIAGPTL